MQIVRQASQVQGNGPPVVVAIGVFDGVHRGHQQVISRAVSEAKGCGGISVVHTFDVHPASVVAPERAPRLIQSLSHRLHEITKLRADYALVQTFTPEYSKTSPSQFVADLVAALAPLRAIVVGESFSFGQKRSGNVGVLRDEAAKFGCAVHAIPPALSDGKPISSTRIREAVRAGNLVEVERLLGRRYSIRSEVKRGDQLGRKMGFPTANLDVSGLEMLPFSVYRGTALTSFGQHKAVANIGVRPSVSAALETRFEAHLLDFANDLYGQEIEFVVEQRIRGEQKFESVDALRQQIARDVEMARAQLA
ncbi:MAG TPA: riboflavin biosynthesis protein RibF [Methylomirabilota bacterium]|nr:riboflavin biosynthesis protein RibF [Methylomirabilota bacterium]